ncbi:MAG: hypothetical protein A2W19_02075 [Spirochaetes bacterium RBG_16_49_21]|nr:MAG: hypothetical protein A2W19_02075 [Spirochaetes bacterium RBG_16_49_21]
MMTSKPKSAGKPKKKKGIKQNDFPLLAQDILSHVGVGIYIVQQGNFIYASPLYQTYSGYSDTEIIGKNPLDYVHPDDREMVREKAIRSLKGENPGSYEYRFIKKNGAVMWVLEMVASISYKDKQSTLGSFMDITGRKSMEDTMRQSEERYRTILENIQEGYYEDDLAGNLTFFNEAVCRIWGYSKEEMIGMNYKQYTDKETAKKLFELFNKIYKTGEPIKAFEQEIIRKDGTKAFAEVSATLIRNSHGKPIGFRGMTRDITERKQMEKAVRQSEEIYRTIIEKIEDGYFEVDLAGNFIFFNDPLCKIHGYPREELMGMNNQQYTDEEDAKKIFEVFNKIYRTGESGKIFDYELIRKDGSKRQVEVSASLKKDSSGNPTGFRGITRDVTERKRMEDILQQSEEKYRTILGSIEEGYYEEDLAGNFTFFNDSMCRIYGYPRDELMGLNYKRYTDEATAERLFQVFNEIYRTGEPSRGYTYELIRKDGTQKYIEASASLRKDSSDKPVGFRGIVRDVTERKRMEETIRQSEERYRTIIEKMEDGYFEVDLAGSFTFVNDAECRNLGYSREELIGMNNRQYADKENAKKVFEAFNKIYKTGEAVKIFDYEVIKKDGTLSYNELSASLIRDAKGKPIGFRGISRNITERKRAEEKIQYLATHDALTGLPNRMMFSQMLNHALQSARRYQRQFAVFFIDLDRFKVINDTLGHEAGDQLLQEIATRLKQTLRAADIVARMGGDEFVILIEEVSELSQVSTVAHRILSATLQPMIITGEECRVTASIGISIFPRDAGDEQSLMKNADMAMYFAKEEGKNNFQFYSKDIKPQSIERLSIEASLRLALERNELSLHYQAKLDFKTNAITGVEALLRWQNPYLGSVSPMHFIPVAEETGLIVPIGRWVLKTACAQNVAWRHRGLPPVCMAVNLSLRQLTDDNLIEDIGTALNDSGLAPNLLELEITESMVMHNPARMIAVLAKIKELGVRLAVDDFGTGYSSLAQLKHFPIDTLKVDRSFIRNIPKDSEDKAITEAIIAMGKTLSLTVVAEGVETQEQMDFLRERSCDEMQGFYFSRPVTPDQFADLLRSHVPGAV